MQDKVIEILGSVLDTDDITPESSQDNVENWDSIHQLMIASALEDAFDVSLEPEEIAEMKSVPAIISIISSKL